MKGKPINAAIYKQSGANFPPKVFATRMKEYAAKKADTRLLSLQAAIHDMQKNMTLHQK